jgi:hypothetical protein
MVLPRLFLQVAVDSAAVGEGKVFFLHSGSVAMVTWGIHSADALCDKCGHEQDRDMCGFGIGNGGRFAAGAGARG